MDLIRDGEKLFTEGDRRVEDPQSVLEGYQWLTQILAVALDCYLWADPLRPQMVQLTSPTRKWGGDNADAFYWYAPVDPSRRYRVTGKKGDAIYLSLTAYGGPSDGHWSTRIVATVNDTTMPLGDDGGFTIELGPDVEPGAASIRLDPDTTALVTRDYLAQPFVGRQAEWRIECLDGPADPPRPDDAELAARYRRATNLLRDLLAVFPIPLPPERNTVQPPYPVPAQTYGWAAGDASYAMGFFDLADGEALVIEGTSPPCVFWNLCLWNQYLQTFDYRYEQVTINGEQCAGVLWFRWFLAESLPEQPRTRVMPVSDLSAN
jgi:hypothetical protein